MNKMFSTMLIKIADNFRKLWFFRKKNRDLSEKFFENISGDLLGKIRDVQGAFLFARATHFEKGY